MLTKLPLIKFMANTIKLEIEGKNKSKHQILVQCNYVRNFTNLIIFSMQTKGTGIICIT